MAVMTGNQVHGSSSTVGAVAEEAKDAAGHVAQIAREQIGTRAEAGKDRAAEGLKDVASTIRGTKEHLPEPLEDYADRAAGWVEGLASYFRDRDIPAMLTDAQQWARREPTIFLGGAFALGLIGARFLKASASRNEEDEHSDFGEAQRQLPSVPRAPQPPGGPTLARNPVGLASPPPNATTGVRLANPQPPAPAKAGYPGVLSEASASGIASPQGHPTGPVRTQVNIKNEGMTSASNNPLETSPGAAKPATPNPLGRADLLPQTRPITDAKLSDQDRPNLDAPRAPSPGVGSVAQHAAGTPGHAQPTSAQAVHDERVAGGVRPAEIKPEPSRIHNPNNPSDPNQGGNRP